MLARTRLALSSLSRSRPIKVWCIHLRLRKMSPGLCKIGLGDAYSMIGSIGQIDAGMAISGYYNGIKEDLRNVSNGTMNREQYLDKYGASPTIHNKWTDSYVSSIL